MSQVSHGGQANNEWERRYADLLDEIRREIPGFRVVRKDQAPIQRAIGLALGLLTLGGQRVYLTRYQTTIRRTVYVTADWDARPAAERYVTMCHERVHLRQFRRYTMPLMALLYLALPLPLGLAWFRAYFEREGYAETLRAATEVYGEAYVRTPEFRRHIVDQFVGPAYGWMWPFRGQIERWYDKILAELASHREPP